VDGSSCTLRHEVPLRIISIFLRIKNTRGIQKKVATVLRPLYVGLSRGQLVVHRTSPEQEAQEYEILLLPEILQLRSTTLLYNPMLPTTTGSPSTTPVYNSALPLPCTKKDSASRSPSNPKKYQSWNSSTVQEYQSLPASYIYIQPLVKS
jgi:hypothetical protein